MICKGPADLERVADDIAAGRIAVIGSTINDPGRNHIPGATPSPCNECNEPVMLSPATRRRMTPRSVVLCCDSAVVIAEQRQQPWFDMGRNTEQLREMADSGIEPRQFKE